jgi:Spy/CpxP family protein refolding chaperone
MDEAGGVRMQAPQSRFDMISNMLKLTKDQKKEFKSAMDEGQKEATPVHEQILKSRDAIAEAVGAAKSQDEINQLINAEAALETQLASIELKAFTKVFKTLDTGQQPQATGLLFMMKGIFNGKNWNSPE